LDQLHQLPEIGIFGWMSHEELQWLYEQASRFQTIVEVGAWFGRSTHALCRGCPGIVFVVDHFRGSPSELQGRQRFAAHGDVKREFLRNVGSLSNLELIQLPSHLAAITFAPKSIDMIFIDGEHTLEDVRLDLRVWLPVARKMICGHDSGVPEVSQAVSEIGLSSQKGPGEIWFIMLEA
jgi:hypothetical protein